MSRLLFNLEVVKQMLSTTLSPSQTLDVPTPQPPKAILAEGKIVEEKSKPVIQQKSKPVVMETPILKIDKKPLKMSRKNKH